MCQKLRATEFGGIMMAYAGPSRCVYGMQAGGWAVTGVFAVEKAATTATHCPTACLYAGMHETGEGACVVCMQHVGMLCALMITHSSI